MKYIHQPKMTERLQLDAEKVITLKVNRSHPLNCGLQIVSQKTDNKTSLKLFKQRSLVADWATLGLNLGETFVFVQIIIISKNV